MHIKKSIYIFKLIDFRNVVARMLGLDASTLAVADYEIIARIERIIGSFNEGVLPVHIQPIHPIQFQPMHLQTTANRCLTNTMPYSTNQEMIYSSSTSQSSAAENYHNYRSHSPSIRQHYHAHSVQVEEGRSGSPTKNQKSRSRSKSPRKVVTIDPNSY